LPLKTLMTLKQKPHTLMTLINEIWRTER